MTAGEQATAATELLSIVLRLQPITSGWIRAAGRAVFVETLRHIGRRNANLQVQLHDSGSLKPFTCSGLLEENPGGAPVHIDSSRFYHIRLTALHGELCREWEQSFLVEPPPQLTLQGCKFAVVDAFAGEEQHAWAGRASYGDLLGGALARVGKGTCALEFELATPAAFRTRGMTMPLPLPQLLFGSLAERWNACSPLKLPMDLRRVGEEEIAVSSFTLASAQRENKNESMQIGGYGEVKYRYLGHDRETVVALEALAAFARYGGVGIKTTQGMGQCRRRG